MHFIAMLGFDPGFPVSYDPGLTLLSLALAIAATWGAFFAAAKERTGGAMVTLAGAAMGEQVRLRGPDVDLAPREAPALGMVFHELATNAAKYGALSAPGGCARVDWSVGEGRLTLDWSEGGGRGADAVAVRARRPRVGRMNRT